MSSRVKILSNAVSAILEAPLANVIDHVPVTRANRVQALNNGVSEAEMNAYRRFQPKYREKLTTVSAAVENVRWSDKVRSYVGLYCGVDPANRNECYLWLYQDGHMIELEQMCVPVWLGVREIDGFAMQRANPWLY